MKWKTNLTVFSLAAFLRVRDVRPPPKRRATYSSNCALCRKTGGIHKAEGVTQTVVEVSHPPSGGVRPPPKCPPCHTIVSASLPPQGGEARETKCKGGGGGGGGGGG